MEMATEPPPIVTFRQAPGRPEFPVYELALALSKQLFTIVELTESVERFYLRDTLDKKSTAVPVAVARAMAEKDMSQRRAIYRDAHRGVTDCLAILDVLTQRGTVEPEVLDGARATATELIARLDRLGDRWRETPYP